MDSQDCFFCEVHKESIVHFFCECEYTKNIWKQITQFIKNKHQCEIQLTASNIIFNQIVEQIDHFANLTCLITKMKIYVNKCLKKKTTVKEIIDEIDFIKNMEYRNIKTKTALKKFNNKWKENYELKV